MTFRGNFDTMRLSAGTMPTSSPLTASPDFPHNVSGGGRFVSQQPTRQSLTWLPRVAAAGQPMGAGDPVGGCVPWLVDVSSNNLPPQLQNSENILSGKPHPLQQHNHHNHHHHHRMAAGTTTSPMMSDFDPRLGKQVIGGGAGGDIALPHLFRPGGAGFESSTKWGHESDMNEACIINACLGGFSSTTHPPPLIENGLAGFRLKDNNINNHHHNNENLFSAIDNGDFEGYSWPELTLTDDFNNQNGEIVGFHNPPAYEEETKEGPDDDRLMFLLLQLGIHRCPVLPDLRLHDNELDLYTVHH